MRDTGVSRTHHECIRKKKGRQEAPLFVWGAWDTACPAGYNQGPRAMPTRLPAGTGPPARPRTTPSSGLPLRRPGAPQPHGNALTQQESQHE